MKTKEIVAIALTTVVMLSGCGKEVERRPNTDFSSTTASVSCIDAVASKKDYGVVVTTNSQKIGNITIENSSSYSLPDQMIPEVTTTVKKTTKEPVQTTSYEEPGQKNSEILPEDNTDENYNQYMYKPSTHYVHRATCHWVDDTCYEIKTTEELEVRLCTECNPDIEVEKEYQEEEDTKKREKEKKKEKKKSSVPETNPDSDYDTYKDAWPKDKRLTPQKGTIEGPSGKETYYNLDMSGVISIMRNMGFSEKDYPYWVRDDGCKMLGNYIMVAANLDIRPRGSTIATSLGTGLVCDTGGFAYYNPTQLDISVTW